jgi:heterodisulfide reductase subunit C
LGVSETLNNVQQRYYWLQAINDVEKRCWQCDACAASCGPRNRDQGQMQQYSFGVLFERIDIHVAGPFP